MLRALAVFWPLLLSDKPKADQRKHARQNGEHEALGNAGRQLAADADTGQGAEQQRADNVPFHVADQPMAEARGGVSV